MTRPTVPATLEELLDTNWLSAALGLQYPGIEVDRVTRGPIVSRVSTNARFSIGCRNGVPNGLSPALCAKGYFAKDQQDLAWVGEPEARFYATIADATGVRTLRCVYAGVHPETRHGVIITEDVIAAGGTFLDALSPYSVEKVAESLEQYARLHAGTWGDAGPTDEWLTSRFSPSSSPGASGFTALRGVEHVRANFEGPLGVDVAEEVRTDPQRVVDAMGALNSLERQAGLAVVHGDAHVGNVFLDAAGRPSLVDWQVVHRNHWSIDVAYHVASALDTSDRRQSERDLLAHYLGRLRANGVDAPSWERAWDDYRTAIAYGVFMWAITLLVDPKIIQRMLQRLTTAAADHDSFGRLGV